MYVYYVCIYISDDFCPDAVKPVKKEKSSKICIYVCMCVCIYIYKTTPRRCEARQERKSQVSNIHIFYTFIIYIHIYYIYIYIYQTTSAPTLSSPSRKEKSSRIST